MGTRFICPGSASTSHQTPLALTLQWERIGGSLRWLKLPSGKENE